MIEGINPSLWQALNVLIVCFRKTRKSQKQTSLAYHIKRMRCRFLMWMMIICSQPLPILVANFIESQGGSAFLHKFLNCLGVCASQDKLSDTIWPRGQSGLIWCWTNIPPEKTLLVVSADHIHPYFHIGKKSSSWHGISVQLVQPLPSLTVQLSGEGPVGVS